VEGIRDILNSQTVMTNVTYNAIFSTVEEYYKAVMSAQQLKRFEWPRHHGDFFPYYQNSMTNIWSGFFSSRSNFKRSVKRLSSLVHASDNYMTIEHLKDRNDSALRGKVNILSRGNELLAEMMHHDTITGTSPNNEISH